MSKSTIKDLLLNEVKDEMGAAKAVIVARYGKLPAEKSWDLRKNLATKGGKLKVVKKGIFVKAAQASNMAFDEKLTEGNIGISFVVVDREDALDAVKTVCSYSKDNADDNFEVLCALIEGQMMPGKEVKILASLPPLNTLRAQLIALLVAPMAQTLSVMQAAIDGPLKEASEPTTQTE